MRDAKGRELKIGDTVVIPCRVTRCSGDEKFNSLEVEAVGVEPWERRQKQVDGLSTKQVYRANEGDDVTIAIAVDGDKTLLK